MSDIRPVPVATQFRDISKEHADIVQKRCLHDEVLVNRLTLFDPFCNSRCEFCNQVAVGKQDALRLVVSSVVIKRYYWAILWKDWMIFSISASLPAKFSGDVLNTMA